MHSRRKILEHIDEKDPKLDHYYNYVSDLGLYSGDCPCAKTVLCNFAAQIDGTYKSGLIRYCTVCPRMGGLFILIWRMMKSGR